MKKILVVLMTALAMTSGSVMAVVFPTIDRGNASLMIEETNSWEKSQEPFSWYKPATLPMEWNQFTSQAKNSRWTLTTSPATTLFEATPSIEQPNSFIGYQRPPETLDGQTQGPTLTRLAVETPTLASYSEPTRRRSLGLMNHTSLISPIGPGNPGYDPDRVAVPEVGSTALVSAVGLLGLAGIHRRFRRK